MDDVGAAFEFGGEGARRQLRTHFPETRGVGQRACASAADGVTDAALAFGDAPPRLNHGISRSSRGKGGLNRKDEGEDNVHAFSFDQTETPSKLAAKAPNPATTSMR